MKYQVIVYIDEADQQLSATYEEEPPPNSREVVRFDIYGEPTAEKIDAVIDLFVAGARWGQKHPETRFAR